MLVAGIYLVCLGITAVVRPDGARRFLSGFASSARVHFLELTLRLAVGAALVVASPRMRFEELFLVCGWTLVGTSVVLFAVPWRLHYRFARWSVPLATRNMTVLATGSLVGGALLLVALLAGRGAV